MKDSNTEKQQDVLRVNGNNLHLFLSALSTENTKVVLICIFPTTPGTQLVKNLPAMQDPGSIPGSVRYPGEGNGNPLQYSCLENSKDIPGRLQPRG